MSTSDIYGLVLPTEADPLSIEVPAGLPDPAVLARMANEFFSALPDGGNNTIREVPSQIPAISAVEVPVTAPALRPEISLTSDPHFQSAPGKCWSCLGFPGLSSRSGDFACRTRWYFRGAV